MTIILIIIGLLLIFVIGFIQVVRNNSKIIREHKFALEYREGFVKFANKYFKGSNNWGETGKLDNELYTWLTKNIYKIQRNVGSFGIMDYTAPYQRFRVPNYEIIINTIPKFKLGNIENFDVTYVDDSLLRYIGYIEEQMLDNAKDLKNPIIWFRVGVQIIFSIPLLFLNWFGILSLKNINKFKNNLFYQISTGIMGLVAFVSGIIAIITGWDKLIIFVNQIIDKL